MTLKMRLAAILFLGTSFITVQSQAGIFPTSNGLNPNGSTGPTAVRPRFIGSYKHYPGVGYYKFYKFAVPFGEAWLQCREDGGHLVVIDSEKELEVVKLILQQARVTGWTYIGVHDLFQNTYYVTVLDKEFTPSNFNKWAPKEPANNVAEACVQVNAAGLLRDISCTSANPFICEHLQESYN